MTTSFSRGSTAHILNVVLCSIATLAGFTGCVIDHEDNQEEPSAPNQPPFISCMAAPACPSDQEEVDSCPEEGGRPCQETTICDQTIYCMESQLVCEPVACPAWAMTRQSCEGAQNPCTSIETGCGTIYCEEDRLLCDAGPPLCPDDTVEVELCDDTVEDCFTLIEDNDCHAAIYCALLENICDEVPTCDEGEVESSEPCEDDEELCQPSTECGRTIYCRSDSAFESVELNTCEPTSVLPMDGFNMNDAYIDGDDLVLNVTYSGGCGLHIFAGCFSHFTDVEPFKVDIQLGHDAQGDLCRGIVSEERRFSLEVIKMVYQAALGVESGMITVNLAGMSLPLEYQFE